MPISWTSGSHVATRRTIALQLTTASTKYLLTAGRSSIQVASPVVAARVVVVQKVIQASTNYEFRVLL